MQRGKTTEVYNDNELNTQNRTENDPPPAADNPYKGYTWGQLQDALVEKVCWCNNIS